MSEDKSGDSSGDMAEDLSGAMSGDTAEDASGDTFYNCTGTN